MGKQRIKPNYRRRVLRLPDLDHCKLAVLNSLGSPASRRVYEYAIDQFIAWYCSEPRLAFNRIVVVRYRMYLESRGLAANTINQQLAAVRRLAHEAADSGLLSPELAAGISRVKGVKQLGFRSGNWLSAEESSEILQRAYGDSMRAKRDYAMLALLFGCGFRRSELVGLEFNEIQMRQGHWAVVDLIGKGGHIPTVPIPKWAKAAVDRWTAAAGVKEGRVFIHSLTGAEVFRRRTRSSSCSGRQSKFSAILGVCTVSCKACPISESTSWKSSGRFCSVHSRSHPSDEQNNRSTAQQFAFVRPAPLRYSSNAIRVFFSAGRSGGTARISE
jgi:integrase